MNLQRDQGDFQSFSSCLGFSSRPLVPARIYIYIYIGKIQRLAPPHHGGLEQGPGPRLRLKRARRSRAGEAGLPARAQAILRPAGHDRLRLQHRHVLDGAGRRVDRGGGVWRVNNFFFFFKKNTHTWLERGCACGKGKLTFRGRPPVMIFSWIGISVLSLAVAYSLAEICSAYPVAGGEYLEREGIFGLSDGRDGLSAWQVSIAGWRFLLLRALRAACRM